MTENEKRKERLKEIEARGIEIRALPKEEMTDEHAKEADELVLEHEQLSRAIALEEKMIALEEKAQERNAYRTPVENPEDNSSESEERRELIQIKPKPIFRNLGEQLLAIAQVSDPRYSRSEQGRKSLENLIKVDEETRTATGVGINQDSNVGFAIQTDFAGTILDTAVKEDPILSRCDTYNAGPESDSVKWNSIDETSIATTVFGGVAAYWTGEGNTVDPSKPKLQQHKLELEKLMGLAYVSAEALKHTTFISGLMSRAFTTAIRRELASAIVSGTGAGKPLGIINGGGTVSQAIETGQTNTDPILYANIVKMWHRLRTEGRSNSVWLMQPDMEENLEFLDFPVGTGGVPVFLTAGSLAQDAGVSTLKGRPVLATDLCSAENSVGDIMLCDLSQYMLLTKGGTEMATSMHVRFVYDESVFKFTHYANGMPKRPNTLTLKNSSKPRGDFVTLAARS